MGFDGSRQATRRIRIKVADPSLQCDEAQPVLSMSETHEIPANLLWDENWSLEYWFRSRTPTQAVSKSVLEGLAQFR